MPVIIVKPAPREGGKLIASLKGGEWLEFEAILDDGTNMRLLDEDHRFRRFPSNGLVWIRRGFDYNNAGERIVDEFRYEASYKDDMTGETIPECFKVNLHMEEIAFDRLIKRLPWGPPEIHLYFELSSEVITDASHNGNSLKFNATPRPWEKIESVSLVQHPWG